MISQTERKRFRAIAHHLRPVVTVAGKGLTESVTTEIRRALDDHELIKIKIVAEREQRGDIVKSVCDATEAELVMTIGGVAVIYKSADKPDPALSNLHRTDIL